MKLMHGHASVQTPTYKCWSNMKTRCYNPKTNRYHCYGARGITVCERWLLFENFLEDMGERPGPNYSIDRINNDGNYEPDNCRWITRSENTRKKWKEYRLKKLGEV